MSNQYSPQTPVDKAGGLKQGYPPAKVALVTTNKESAAVSSVLQFTHNTTEIEVAAFGGPVVGKWISTATASVIAIAGTANFDFVVPTTTVRRFVVPIFSGSTSGSVQGVNRAEGLYQGVAYISAGVASSVLTAEF